MPRYHWGSSRFSTFAPQRQQRRSVPSTCSRASVPSLGHQSTGETLRYARPLLQELEEQPLVPAVVLGVAGHDLGVPGERRAHRPQLAAHLLDVGHGPVARVHPVLDRGVLGRQPEPVEPDGQEHVEAVHPLVAGDRVRRRLDVPVADVQRARRVGVHREQEEPRPGAVVEVRVVEAEVGPARLPPGLDGRGLVALGAGARVADGVVAGGLDVACRCHGPVPALDETKPPAGPGEGSGCRR